MAVPGDFVYLRHALRALTQPGDSVLEVGSRAWQGEAGNARRVVESEKRTWAGTDLVQGDGVDFTLDILDTSQVQDVGRQWSSVLLMNLLEHVFDPVLALRNSLKLVEPGGSLIVVSPAFWELHDFPRDYWRPMPDLYIEFAERHGLELPGELLCWVLREELLPVLDLQIGGQKFAPSRQHAAAVWGHQRRLLMKAVFKLAKPFDRFLAFPRMGLGVALRKPAPPRPVTDAFVGRPG